MKMPSIPEIMTIIQDVLTIFSEGGQRALAFLFILNLAAIGLVCWLLFKFLIKFMKEHNDSKEKALADKDEILNASRARSEALNEQYAKLATQSIEREQILLTEMRELKTLVTLFLTNGNRNSRPSNDDEDDDSSRRSRKRRSN